MLDALFVALSAVVPVFLVIGLGIWLRRQEVLPDNAGRVLGLYVLKIALPLLVLHLFAQARPEDLARGSFWLGLLLSQGLMFALVWSADRLAWRKGRREAIVAGMNCCVSNMAFVGLPIICNLFPANAEALLVAGLAILSPNLAIALIQARLDWLHGSANNSLRSFLRRVLLGNPLLLAALTGCILAGTGWGLWIPLDRTVSLLGYTAAPCMLLSLGLDLRTRVAMARQLGSGSIVARQSWLLTCKLFIHPLLCWLLLYLFGVEGLWLTVSVLLSATGAALVNALMAEVYDAGPAEVALSVVLSNGLSMFTVTAFIWIFLYLGMV
ncbi:MAG: AEC family transporter [Desulfovibrio sp.]|nr:AEC family transporter [Desulfovibrio sp.]